MQKIGNIVLTVNLSHRKTEGKVKVATDVVIRVGNAAALAFKSFMGRANKDWVLKEFKKNPGTFTVQPGWTEGEMIAVALAS